MNKLHLTSVKLLKDLYKEFKYEALKSDQTLQKVVNRSLFKYVNDSTFREQINEEISLTISGSNLWLTWEKTWLKQHKVNVENMMENAVGVSEHPDIMDSIEKELAIMAEYDDKLSVLNKYFSSEYDSNKEVLNG